MEKQQNLRLSPSSVITFVRCPREFYYRYVLRLPTPTNIHLIKGIIVHRVLEWFYKGKFKPNFEAYVEELFNKAFEEKREEWESLLMDKKESDMQKHDCLNMLALYIHTLRLKIDFLRRIGKVTSDRHAYYLMRPKLREMWIEDKDLNFCGFIDRVHKDWDDNITIGDYKTSSRYGIGIKDEYELQCGLYALLYNRETGKNADYTSIIYLRYGEEVMTRVTPDGVRNALDTLMLVRSKVGTTEIKDYPKKEAKFCKFCNFFGKCSGQEPVNDEIRRKKAIKEVLGNK